MNTVLSISIHGDTSNIIIFPHFSINSTFKYMNPILLHDQNTQLHMAAAVCLLLYYNRIRKRTRLTRSATLYPAASPWRHVLENGDEPSFLHLTGFSRLAFENLHTTLYVLFLDQLQRDVVKSSTTR